MCISIYLPPALIYSPFLLYDCGICEGSLNGPWKTTIVNLISHVYFIKKRRCALFDIFIRSSWPFFRVFGLMMV